MCDRNHSRQHPSATSRFASRTKTPTHIMQKWPTAAQTPDPAARRYHSERSRRGSLLSAQPFSLRLCGAPLNGAKLGRKTVMMLPQLGNFPVKCIIFNNLKQEHSPSLLRDGKQQNKNTLLLSVYRNISEQRGPKSSLNDGLIDSFQLFVD